MDALASRPRHHVANPFARIQEEKSGHVAARTPYPVPRRAGVRGKSADTSCMAKIELARSSHTGPDKVCSVHSANRRRASSSSAFETPAICTSDVSPMAAFRRGEHHFAKCPSLPALVRSPSPARSNVTTRPNCSRGLNCRQHGTRTGTRPRLAATRRSWEGRTWPAVLGGQGAFWGSKSSRHPGGGHAKPDANSLNFAMLLFRTTVPSVV